MPYIALRPVKFNKQYNIGDMIQNEVIKPDITARLLRCGVIQDYVENQYKSINNQDNLYELINKMKDDELLLLYENTRLKEVVELVVVSEILEQEKVETESKQENEIESANNDNTEINDNKELKRAKTSKSKKV